jgi:hypothetical protein
MRQQHRQIEERHLHLLAEQIVDGGCGAAIGNVHDVDVGRHLEQFTGEMRQAADAGRCEIEFPRLRLGERDQLLHVAGGHVAGDDEHFRHRRHQRDGHKILRHVVRHFLQDRIDDQRTRADDADRVAVGGRLCDRIGAEHAGLAATIVDQHRLLRDFRHALADQTRDDIVRPAGRERHDQPDRFAREILRCRHSGQQHGQSGEEHAKSLHQASGHLSWPGEMSRPFHACSAAIDRDAAVRVVMLTSSSRPLRP